MSALPHRGIIEGFYGTPWSHDDRLWWIDRLGDWRMNRYVHAPKDDPFHRDRWRESYPETQQREFAELIERGHSRGVEVGFAFSPGLSIQYASAEDRAILVAKLRGFAAMGSRFFTLALDDVPSRLTHEADRQAFGSLAEAHIALSQELFAALDPDATLWVIPTDYLGTESTEYLEALGTNLDPKIEIGWTGRTVLSPEIDPEHARARAAVLKRPVLLWDNTPVADGPMRPMLHLNPYTGRPAELAAHISGALLNPMAHARASALTVHTAARYFLDPAGYDPQSAFKEAAAELGSHAPEAFTLFAQAHRFSPLTSGDRDSELESQLDSLRARIESGDTLEPALDSLRESLARRTAANRDVRLGIDPKLGVEIAPWLASHASETLRMTAAIDCIAGVAGASEAKESVFALLALESTLSREPIPSVASYGPRRVLYPQLTSMRDDEMALTNDATLITDRCLADDFVKLAEAYAMRCTRAGARAN